MKRIAKAHLSTRKNHIRTATTDRVSLDPNRLYFTLDALHWEQSGPPSTGDKELYPNRQSVYTGNDNGDFFEGGRNVVWACRNPNCTNTQDVNYRKGTFRFLKYEDQDQCPHCGSTDIFDWEKEAFGTDGELLAKTQDGKYRFETWKGEPVNVNHDDKRRVGEILDVWVDPPAKAVVELLAIDKQGPHDNKRIAQDIEAGKVDSGSMELYTGVGLCSICFNVHYSDQEFCKHLNSRKGMLDLKTGQHIFEICKSVKGCGHALIVTGDPADSGALVRTVFASADPSNLNGTMNPTEFDGKPDFSERKAAATKKISGKTVAERRVEGGEAAGASVSVALPKFTGMKDQLENFGNFDSTRSDRDIRLAKMTPQERAEYEEFEQFRAAKKQGRSAAVHTTPTLRINREFVAGVFGHLVGTKKVTAQALADSLVELSMDPTGLTTSLASRKTASNSFARLGMRKAQLVDAASVEELVLDAIADSMISAGEQMKMSINDITLSDVAMVANEVADSPAATDSFVEEIEANEPTVSHAEPPISQETGQVAPDGSPSGGRSEDEHPESLQEEQTMHTAQRNAKPENPPTNPANPPTSSGKGTNAKPENPPTNPEQLSNPAPVGGTTLHIALSKRLSSIDANIASGEGDLDALLQDREKVTAQLKKLSTEKGPDSPTNLGGNGIDENPKPAATSPAQHKVTPEKGPDSPNALGGNGIDENPKPVRMGQKDEGKEEDSEDEKSESSKKEPKEEPATEPDGDEDDTIAGIESQLDEMVEGTELHAIPCVEGESLQVFVIHFDPKAENLGLEKVWGSEPITLTDTDALGALLDEVEKVVSEHQPTPMDDDERSEFTKKKAALISGPDFTERLAELNIEKPIKARSATPEEAPRKAQVTKPVPDSKTIDLKNQNSKTKVPDMGKHTQGTPTPVGKADAAQDGLEGKKSPTKPGAGEAEDIDGQNVKGSETPTSTKADDNLQDQNLGRTTPSPVGREREGSLKTASIEAEFTQINDKGRGSDSHWTLHVNGQPAMRVALKTAFPGEVVKSWKRFASEDYGQALIDAAREQGLESLNAELFGGEAEILRTAQATLPASTPEAQPNAPATVDPAVADRILNDSKPGIPTVDLIVGYAAALIAESDSLSVTGFVEDLVNMAQNQEKVTELTTKLNTAVQTIKTNAGLPQEPAAAASPAVNAPAAPAPGGTPTAPAAGGPTLVQAERVMGENEKRWAQKLQMDRIGKIVQAEQEVGLIPNYRFYSSREGGNMSRKAAHEAGQQMFQKRCAELAKLNEDAYLAVESDIREKVRMAKLTRGEQRPEAVRRAQRFQEMKREAGGHVIGSVPGENTNADPFNPNGPSIGFKFKAAGGVDPKRHAEAMKARDQRDGRQSR